MKASETDIDVPAPQKVVQMELIVQTRQKGADSWRDHGKPFPALFDEEARRYLKLVRVGYPGVDSQLVERSVIYSDRVVEG